MTSILPKLPSLTLNGIIDILLVGFLIYQALLVVRGTRAGHILVGILFLVSLYAAANLGRLEALRTVLNVIGPYLGIAIIILFQSEIRRTLAGLGRKRWLGYGFRVPDAVSGIALAVKELQEKKQGALIVLERDIGLRTFIESGVRIDGRLSRELLISIFYPETALHDGAVIVQKDKIAAAGCFLPLSTNPALKEYHGTRHRAAVGITEEADCLSIVVSEETGRISVAAFGELVSGLTLTELDQRVREHFGTQHSPAPVKATVDEAPADIPLPQEAPPVPPPVPPVHAPEADPAARVERP